MYTWYQRANNILALAMSMAALLLAAVILSGPLILLMEQREPAVELSLAKAVMHRLPEFDVDGMPDRLLAGTTFDLRADFTNLFNWNTKQINAYLTCEYKNPDFPVNQLIVWDRIIKSRDAALLELGNANPKYWLVDIQDKLNSQKVNYSLHWNIVPYVGIFLWGVSGSVPVKLPDSINETN